MNGELSNSQVVVDTTTNQVVVAVSDNQVSLSNTESSSVELSTQEQPVYVNLWSDNIPNVMADRNYVHLQQQSVTPWVINHNLNKFCSVTVVNDESPPKVVVGDVTYDSANTLTITFGSAFSGKAYLN